MASSLLPYHTNILKPQETAKNWGMITVDHGAQVAFPSPSGIKAP